MSMSFSWLSILFIVMRGCDTNIKCDTVNEYVQPLLRHVNILWPTDC